MKEAITALSKQQNFILQTLFTHIRVDAPTASRTQKYYRELRRLTTTIHTEPIPIDHLMKAAILIAEHSQEVYNLRGDRIGCVNLALNQILRSTHNLKGIVAALKIYLSLSKATDSQLKQDIVLLIDHLTFGHNFVTKFRKAIEYFELVQEVDENNGYRSLFESFSWLMFLNMHEQVPTHSNTQVDYLLISVLYLMVRYAHPFLRLSKMPPLPNNKALIASILQQLFSIFVIDDPLSFKKINAAVDSYFQRLISTEVIKCRFDYDFLSPSLIRHNYKKLDALYQRGRSADSVDFRMFLTNRHETLTPTKYARVSPKQIANKVQTKQQSFTSHRILSFQNEVQSKVNAQTNSKQIKLPSNVRVSPSYIKTPLLCAQRTSPTLTIQLYMAKTIKSNEYRLQLLDNESEVLSVIEHILGQLKFEQPTLEERANSTFNYYIVLQTRILNEEHCLQQDLNGIYCSALIHSILFTAIERWTHEQELQGFIRLALRQIGKEVEINGYHLWMVAKYILKDGQLPPRLRQFLVCLEMQCVNEYVWKDIAFEQTKTILAVTDENESHNQTFADLSARIKKELKGLIDKIFATPQFASFSALLHQKVYSTLLHIATNQPQILLNRHLHQIALCACYLAMKAAQPQIRFNDLIQQHQLANHLSSQELRYIIYKVQLCTPEGEAGEVNIIEFYNRCYLPFAKLLPTHYQQAFQAASQNDAKTEANPHNQRFSDICKTYSHTKRQSLSRLIPSPQPQKVQKTTKIAEEAQTAQISQKIQTDKSSKEQATFEPSEQPRDETRQRERGPGVSLHWLRTEKGKGANCLR